MDDRITLYREWLPLEKKQFRILAMLSDKGEYTGNLSTLCDYFSLSRQQHNRNALRTAIEQLAATGYITYTTEGRTYRITAIPKATAITIPREWLQRLIAHDYSSEDVAWEQVLKVLLWVCDNKKPVIQNQMIADDLHVSVSTIGYAKNVLQYEYAAIRRRKVSEKIGDDFFRTIGQELAASAWWSN